MYPLNKNQVEIITRDVENASITFSHLADDLIDHICCEVEYLMSDGEEFNEAYKQVKQQAESTVLKKIQDSTIYLIDKNYRRMKTTTKITGNISLILLGIGTVMKISHWAGGNIILLLGFVVLCLVFFPSAIYTNYKEQKIKGPKILHLSILFGGILFMAGVLFKVLHLPGAGTLLLSGWIFILFIFLPILMYVKLKQANTIKEKRIIVLGIVGLIVFELSSIFKLFHYPGAAILMIIGSIIIVTLFLPLYTYSKFKEENKISGEFIFLMLSTMFFFLLSILIALNVSIDVSKVYIKEGKDISIITNYLEMKNQNIYAEINKTDSLKKKYEQKITSIQKEAANLCHQIDSIKLVLVMAAEQVNETRAKELMNSLEYMNNKFNLDIASNMLVGEKGNGLARKLEQNIQEFKQNAISLTSSNQALSSSISKILDTSDISKGNGKIPWERFTFEEKPLIGSLNILANIENDVKMVESKAISYLTIQNR